MTPDHRFKVLLVEDDEVQGEILKSILDQNHYDLKYCTSGKEAIAALASYLPDLICCDIYLGDTTGIEVLEKAREIPALKSTPILMMTVDTSEDTAVLALMKEADEILIKPLRHSEFLLKVRIWLDRKVQRDKLLHTNQMLEAQSRIMSQYFSDDIIKKITDSGEGMKPEVLPATVMFFDLRNFTALSENLSPENVADLLNTLFPDLMDLIFSHSGSVNKFIGDAIMATFGVPITQGNDAENAVRCAIAIRDSMELFKAVRPDYLKSDLGYGIGIASGHVFSGAIGSFRRLEYTVLGDVVNIASRLEALNKISHTNILIDGKTKELCGPTLQAKKVIFGDKIRGKTREVEIYMPIAFPPQD